MCALRDRRDGGGGGGKNRLGTDSGGHAAPNGKVYDCVSQVGAVKTLHHKISVRIKTSDHILTVPHPQAEVSPEFTSFYV